MSILVSQCILSGVLMCGSCLKDELSVVYILRDLFAFFSERPKVEVGMFCGNVLIVSALLCSRRSSH